MYARTFIILALVVVASEVQAAADLHGVVLANELGGPPMGNRPEEARKGFEEALKIRRELAQKDPDTYLPAVAHTLDNLANLDRAQNRPEEARKGFEEALNIYERFAEGNPERFQSDVARVKRQLQTLSK